MYTHTHTHTHVQVSGHQLGARIRHTIHTTVTLCVGSLLNYELITCPQSTHTNDQLLTDLYGVNCRGALYDVVQACIDDGKDSAIALSTLGHETAVFLHALCVHVLEVLERGDRSGGERVRGRDEYNRKEMMDHSKMSGHR